jgi:acyl carrier protein
MTKLHDKIVSLIAEIAANSGLSVVDDLTENTVLLESGLDSLGFAVLVARLEEDLGYDPFVLTDEPVYPRTLGDLIAIYERFRP